MAADTGQSYFFSRKTVEAAIPISDFYRFKPTQQISQLVSIPILLGLYIDIVQHFSLCPYILSKG